MEIRGKVALVLGGARGIGKAIGFALAERGARVIMTCYDWPEESAVMGKELALLDGQHCAVRVDLRDPHQVKELIGRVRSEYGKLHILVNNIERGGMPVVHGSYDLEVNREQWDLEMATTLRAKWLVFNHALPLLMEAGEGVVVTLSSIAGLVGRSGPAAPVFSDGYGAANRAVSSFTETWAREAAPHVRVNELMLGFFETRHAEGTKGWQLLSDGEKAAIQSHTLLQRTGCLDDVVRAVLFLIRDANFMTGAVVRLDGGYVLGGEGRGALPAGILDDLDMG